MPAGDRGVRAVHRPVGRSLSAGHLHEEPLLLRQLYEREDGHGAAELRLLLAGSRAQLEPSEARVQVQGVRGDAKPAEGLRAKDAGRQGADHHIDLSDRM